MNPKKVLKKWCFDKAPVYFSPGELQPSSSLKRGAVVELTGQKQNTIISGFHTSWTEIVYGIQDKQAETHWVTGWVNDACLDDYHENFPDSGVVIPNPTKDPHDAQQYLAITQKEIS